MSAAKRFPALERLKAPAGPERARGPWTEKRRDKKNRPPAFNPGAAFMAGCKFVQVKGRRGRSDLTARGAKKTAAPEIIPRGGLHDR